MNGIVDGVVGVVFDFDRLVVVVGVAAFVIVVSVIVVGLSVVFSTVALASALLSVSRPIAAVRLRVVGLSAILRLASGGFVPAINAFPFAFLDICALATAGASATDPATAACGGRQLIRLFCRFCSFFGPDKKQTNAPRQAHAERGDTGMIVTRRSLSFPL